MTVRGCAFFIMGILFSSLNIWAQNEPDIQELMKKDDYINVSLLTLSPGDEIYAAAGHLAVRMSCPIQDVDYAYEFVAVSDSPASSYALNFLTGRQKGSYIRHFTSDFYMNANYKHREVTETPLYLTPDQEVTLWSKLDELADAGELLPFIPSTSNCCTRLMQVLEESVGEDTFGSLINSPLYDIDKRNRIEEAAFESPWSGFLWNILFGMDFDRADAPYQLINPHNAASLLHEMTNRETGKPLAADKDVNVSAAKQQSPIRPEVIMGLMLVVAIILTGFNAKGRLQSAGRYFDILMMSLTGVIGCMLWVILLSSLFSGNLYLSPLLPIFSPLPLAVLALRKSELTKWFVSITVILCIAALVASYFTPQLRLYGMRMLWICLCIRCANYIYENRTSNRDSSLKLIIT